MRVRAIVAVMAIVAAMMGPAVASTPAQAVTSTAAQAITSTPAVTDRAARDTARRVIVSYPSPLRRPGVARLAAIPQVTAVERGGVPDLAVVTVDQPADRAATLRALRADPRVSYAEHDRLVRPTRWPTADAHADQLWGLRNAGQQIAGLPGRAGVDVGAPRAWRRTRGEGIVVAVIDSGVHWRHPDLRANMWVNREEIPRNGRDDDGNGYIDDRRGWDFANDDASVFDSPTADDHGTHVAGTIGAVANNRHGIVGVAPAVQIMPLKFIHGEFGRLSDLVAAIRFADHNGADVINASFGAYQPSRAEEAAIRDFDGLFVTAAGNEARDNDGPRPSYPASYDLDNILSVGAVRNDGAWARFSNVGASSVDLAAPGVGILSTLPGGRYGAWSGTSMAAPHVAGVGALAKAAHPLATGPRLARLLRATATPLAAASGRTASGGLVSAPAAAR